MPQTGLSSPSAVDRDGAQLEQIADCAKSLGGVCVIADGRRQPGILAATPIRPRSRNKRAAAVRQNHKQFENTSPRQAPDDRKSASFKGMPFTCNDRRNLNVLVMGSLSCLRSIRFRMRTSSNRWPAESPTGTCYG
jgi:hypothetical protein